MNGWYKDMEHQQTST